MSLLVLLFGALLGFFAGTFFGIPIIAYMIDSLDY
jgi:hypothetical protein